MFQDREQAARRLADRLADHAGRGTVVAALARGAVPMGCLLAEALDAELYVLVVRKIGAPGNRELAIGAITDGEHPQTWLNHHLVQALGVTEAYIAEAVRRETLELQRRKQAYGADLRNPPLAGRTVIVTDDGIATGATMRMALAAVRRQRPARCILAVPVAPPEALPALREAVDEVICLEQPRPFGSVGQHYLRFSQVDDDEVVRLLADFDRRRLPARRGAAGGGPA